MNKLSGRRVLLIACLVTGGTATASSPVTLRDVTREAIGTNPEVLAAFDAFQASEQQLRGARGGYLPRVDLEAGIGHERIDDPRFGKSNYERSRISLMVTQMLFDGFATRNQVSAFSQESRMRYFDVLAASETVAAEVARAYLDVLRHRELVDLSKENYAAHRMVLEQIERRVRSGVSRGVDLDQSAGRLALSEANLLTDLTNLHDVSARYQRLVGQVPPAQLAEPDLAAGLLPDSLQAAIGLAYTQSPQLSAAVANAWAASSAAEVPRAAMLPRLDIRARQDYWDDGDVFAAQYDRGVIELVLSYNLYRGGADRAERRRLDHRADQAANLRNQVCHNIRQEVSIAYNEMRALEEQMVFLRRHTESIARAREAYRSQFDIGQRTLLDLLDSENEYYESRRAYVNARRQYDVAYTRVLAGVGQLIQAMQLGPELPDMTLRDQGGAEAPELTGVCPAVSVPTPVIDKDAIYREVLQRRGESRQGAPAAGGDNGGA